MRPNQVMPFRQAQGPELAVGQRTAGWCAFSLSIASTLYLQQRSFLPGFADLESHWMMRP